VNWIIYIYWRTRLHILSFLHFCVVLLRQTSTSSWLGRVLSYGTWSTDSVSSFPEFPRNVLPHSSGLLLPRSASTSTTLKTEAILPPKRWNTSIRSHGVKFHTLVLFRHWWPFWDGFLNRRSCTLGIHAIGYKQYRKSKLKYCFLSALLTLVIKIYSILGVDRK
jgi:hypothetical protein